MTSGRPEAKLRQSGSKMERILVAGGEDTSDIGQDLSTTEIYDPATGIWRAGPPMSYARRDPKLFHLANGDVLVFGGLVFGNQAPVEFLKFGATGGAEVQSAMATLAGTVVSLSGNFGNVLGAEGIRVRLESRLGGPDVIAAPLSVDAGTVKFQLPASAPAGSYFARVEAPGRVGIGAPVTVQPSQGTTANGNACTSNTDCSSHYCVGAVCCPTACAGGTCAGGVCSTTADEGVGGGGADGGGAAPVGETCGANWDCLSGHCVGLMCCASACVGGDSSTGYCTYYADGGTSDGGTGSSDAGTGITDGGSAGTDGGSAGTDGGSAGTDGGSAGTDGGSAGTDAGASSDGGVKTKPPQLYGCLCGQGGSDPGWAVFLLVLVLLRFNRRRRVGLWVVLLGAVVATGPARAQSAAPPAPKPIGKVAVLELQAGPGVDPKLAAVITPSLTAAMQARGQSVLSSQDIKAALGFEAQTSLSGARPTAPAWPKSAAPWAWTTWSPGASPVSASPT